MLNNPNTQPNAITNNLNNYIGESGLVTQSYQDCVNDLTQRFQNIYGSEVNLASNTPDGQWIGILAQEKSDFLDLFTQFYNNLNVDTVVGIPQQILYLLNGLTIKAYTFSYVYVNVVVTGAVNLTGLDDNINNINGTGYTVSDTNGNNWILASSISLATPGTYTLNFRAEQLGGIQAAPNTITIMQTVVPNVSSVSNPAMNYITGGTGESASEFRQRRNQSMSAPSQGFDEAIEGQLLALENVIAAKVYDNRTNQTVNGIPPHSVWVIVQGGQSQQIAPIIYYNLPPGIGMKGEQSVTLTKSNGGEIEVLYDQAQPQDLHIQATVDIFSTENNIDETYIKNELSQLTFQIYQMAQNSQIILQLKNIIGETGEPYDVQVSTDGDDWQEYLYPTSYENYFTISPENIDLTINYKQ